MMMAAIMGRRPVQSGVILSQLERHKIQILLEAGTRSTMSRRCSASKDTVRRVQRETAVVHTDAREHRERRYRPTLEGRAEPLVVFHEKR